MRAVAQRVSQASVEVNDEVVGRIGHGLLVYLGASREDGPQDVAWMANKLATLRVFPDADGRMSLDVCEVGGQVLVVSQFTLFGDVRKGRRPSFERAAEPEAAKDLYEALCGALSDRGLVVATGRFRAMMRVRADVDGPVTILVDSKKAF